MRRISIEMWDSVPLVLTTTISITVQSVLQSEMSEVHDRFTADLHIVDYHINELKQYTRRDLLMIGGLTRRQQCCTENLLYTDQKMSNFQRISPSIIASAVVAELLVPNLDR